MNEKAGSVVSVFMLQISKCLVGEIVYRQLKITSNGQDETTTAKNYDTTQGLNSVSIGYGNTANAAAVIVAVKEKM